MLELSFKKISQAIRGLKLPHFDLVLGIAKGGLVPASLIAYGIKSDLKIIRVKYRDKHNNPRYSHPLIAEKIDLPKSKSKILLVDDVAISGETLNAVKKLLKRHKVKTLVLRGKADYVLFPGLNSCVKWPWSCRE